MERHLFIISISLFMFANFTWAKPDQSNMRSVAEQELSVSELAGADLSQVKAQLTQPREPLKTNSFAVSAAISNLQITGLRRLRSFETVNYSELSQQPYFNLRWSWVRRIFDKSWYIQSTADAGFGTVEFEIQPHSGFSEESARLNTLTLGAWSHLGKNISPTVQVGAIAGYRKWSFQQSASTKNGVFSEEADTLHLGAESNWEFRPRASLGLQVFGSSTLASEALTPNTPLTVQLVVTRAL